MLDGEWVDPAFGFGFVELKPKVGDVGADGVKGVCEIAVVGDDVDVVHESETLVGVAWLSCWLVLLRAVCRVSAKAAAAMGQPMGTPRLVLWVTVVSGFRRQW